MEMNRHEIQSSILDMDATEIAEAIKRGDFTSYEATHTYIEHIKKVNPALNALVEDRFADALEDAKKLDKQPNPIGALHGVPISVKEAYDVEMMKTTGGLLHRQDLIQRNDADVVKKLKSAGAVILGKTNTPTLCFCQETDNKLYGRTNNPWDITRTAGGSSGGEGALLGAGGAAVGIGSDIGGSIRFPSHFNGVVGFKPGMYQVSQTGHFPPVRIPLQERMLGLGPMGKSVRDNELVYKIITDHILSDQTLSDFGVDIFPTNLNYPLSEKTKTILTEIKGFLNDLLPTTEGVPPFFHESALLWQEIMSIDGGKSIKDTAFTSDRTSALTEFIKEKATEKSSVHIHLSWALIGAKLFKPSKERITEIEEIIHKGDLKIKNHLKKRLQIFPVYHHGALKHGKVYNEIFSIRKTFLKYMPFVAYANVWGLPSLVIPVGIDENKMPISIQIMSSNGNESAIFELGKRIEEAFRGYIRCTNLD